MLNRKSAVKISTGLLLLVLLAVPQLSYAYWGVGVDVHIGDPGYRHFYGWRDHPQYGWHIHYLPAGHVTVLAGGVRYHYYDGLYYKYAAPEDYVLVNPPVGAYVKVIPSDFQPVAISGRTYYRSNGIYYVLTPHRGYRVVVAP